MIETSIVVENCQVAKDIWQMKLRSPGIAAEARPGQFVNVRLTEKLDPLLRRPISLHKINAHDGTFSMLYLVIGEGTKMLTSYISGDSLDVLGPLGNGFTLNFTEKNVVLVGGGIGVAPLFPLAEVLISAGKNVTLAVGAKNKEYLTDYTQYEAIGVKIKISTDDGSFGFHGFVSQIVDQEICAGNCERIIACGPVPMLRSIEKLALDRGIIGEVSTESHMGCGLGVCLLCPSKLKSGGYKRTCTDGPVFPIGELDYD